MSAGSLLEAALAVIAGVGAAFWTAAALRLWTASRRAPRLPEVDAAEPMGGWPRVSVVVPARDEERTVEAAIRTLLALDYPSVEVVAVDDRSTDATGGLLDRLAAEDPRVSVRHVKALPVGWLGKTHALAEGAMAARGEWLLFTDADVHFAPDALKRAVAFALRHRLGHFVLFPHLLAPGFLERSFVCAFAVFANLKFRVWQLHRPGTRGFVGMGAFNLVRRDAYEAVGGHAGLALEVVDDVKLGLVLRRSGVPQGAGDSGGLVRVRWQEGFLASLRGLEKNAFAAAEWSLPTALLGAASVFLLSAGPFLALLLLSGRPARLLALLGALAFAAIQGAIARRAASGSGLEALASPLSGALLAGVLLWSAVAATWRRGIVWRGTYYPLEALRRGCVRRRDWPAARAVGWKADRG